MTPDKKLSLSGPSPIGIIKPPEKPIAPPEPIVTVTPKVVEDTGQVAKTFLLYGSTGTFKTTQLARIALYIYEKYGLKTRLVTVEVGSIAHIMDYVNAGIIDLFPVVESVNPITLLKALGQGAWKPFSKNGKLTPARILHERKLIGEVEIEVVRKVLQEPVGMYAFEGLTSGSTRLMRYLIGQGRKITEDVASPWSEESMVEGEENVKFGSPAKSHYGWTQNYMLDLVAAFSSLPARYVGFTAHEGKGEDESSRTPEYGPAVIGKAATSKIPDKVGDLFHLETVEAKVGGIGKPVEKSSVEVRAYFQKHPDSQNSSILWPAKPRFPERSLDKLAKKYPNGYITLDADPEGEGNIANYFRFRDEVEESGTNSLMEWKKKMDERK